MKKFEVPEGQCITCRRTLNAAKSLHHHKARPGDITICVFCGALMRFGPKMELLPAPQEVLAAVRKSALWGEVVKIQKRLNKLL